MTSGHSTGLKPVKFHVRICVAICWFHAFCGKFINSNIFEELCDHTYSKLTWYIDLIEIWVFFFLIKILLSLLSRHLIFKTKQNKKRSSIIELYSLLDLHYQCMPSIRYTPGLLNVICIHGIEWIIRNHDFLSSALFSFDWLSARV